MRPRPPPCHYVIRSSSSRRPASYRHSRPPYLASATRAPSDPQAPCPPMPRTPTIQTPGDGAAVSFKKSRNELKREARRAVKWGMDLAKFSPPQIKCILSAASLEREVFDTLMLVKKFGPDVREGRRRQFNYIGPSVSLIMSYLHFLMPNYCVLLRGCLVQ